MMELVVKDPFMFVHKPSSNTHLCIFRRCEGVGQGSRHEQPGTPPMCVVVRQTRHLGSLVYELFATMSITRDAHDLQHSLISPFFLQIKFRQPKVCVQQFSAVWAGCPGLLRLSTANTRAVFLFPSGWDCDANIGMT